MIANEFIQCRKVCEHVLEKVLGSDLPTSDSNGNSNSSQNNSQSDGNSESSQIPAEERIELLCNEVVSKGECIVNAEHLYFNTYFIVFSLYFFLIAASCVIQTWTFVQ